MIPLPLPLPTPTPLPVPTPEGVQQFVNVWWPRIFTALTGAGFTIGGLWAFVRWVLPRMGGFKDHAIWAVVKTGLVGKAQDKAEAKLVNTLNANIAALEQLIAAEEQHRTNEVALVRSQMGELMADQATKLTALQRKAEEAEERLTDCEEGRTALREEMNDLQVKLALVARGELAQWDRRTRTGRPEDRADPPPPGPTESAAPVLVRADDDH